MLTVENVFRVLEYEGYGSSILRRAIEQHILETVPYNGAYSSYNYVITSDSFHSYLNQLGLPERKIDNIMDNIQTVS